MIDGPSLGNFAAGEIGKVVLIAVIIAAVVGVVVGAWIF